MLNVEDNKYPMTIGQRREEILTKFKIELQHEELAKLSQYEKPFLEEMNRKKSIVQTWKTKFESEMNEDIVTNKLTQSIIRVPSYGHSECDDTENAKLIKKAQEEFCEELEEKGFPYIIEKMHRSICDFMDGWITRETILIKINLQS